MRRWGRCLPPLIPMSLTLELRSWPARQHRALLLPYAKGHRTVPPSTLTTIHLCTNGTSSLAC